MKIHALYVWLFVSKRKTVIRFAQDRRLSMLSSSSSSDNDVADAKDNDDNDNEDDDDDDDVTAAAAAAVNDLSSPIFSLLYAITSGYLCTKSAFDRQRNCCTSGR